MIPTWFETIFWIALSIALVIASLALIITSIMMFKWFFEEYK